jgi:hypothetical protein
MAWMGGLAAAAIVIVAAAMTGLFDGLLPAPDPYPPVLPTVDPTPYVTEPPVHWPAPRPYGGRGCCCEYEFVSTWDFIDGRFIGYVGTDRFMEFIEYYTENYTAQSLTPRMAMVVFVEYFDIPRESFDRINDGILETARNDAIEQGIEFVYDPQDWYNADIIYSFDDAIINEFYRNRSFLFSSIWYSVPGPFADYVGAERFSQFSAWWAASGLQGRRMEALGFIDYFNLSRQDFDRLNALWNERRAELEGFEDDISFGLNADIIFTFDDAIINGYYRVVPTMLPVTDWQQLQNMLRWQEEGTLPVTALAFFYNLLGLQTMGHFDGVVEFLHEQEVRRYIILVEAHRIHGTTPPDPNYQFGPGMVTPRGHIGSNCAGTDCPHRDDEPFCVIHGPAGSAG